MNNSLMEGSDMQFIKSLNNNAALVSDDNKCEYVVIGTGLGFGYHSGDLINMDRIQRRFKADIRNKDSEIETLNFIRPDALAATERIAHEVETKLNLQFSRYQYLALADHMDLTLKRLEQAIYLPDTTMGWAIRKLYNKEYELALYVIKTLNQSDVLSVKLPDSEASSLVLHFVNAENKQDQVQDTVEITKLIAGIIQIVQLDFQETLDSKSFNYSRFITHLRGFMVNKMSKEDEIETEQELDPSFLNLMQAKYSEAYMTVQRIALYLKQQRNWQLSNNEQVYLTLHVWRVTHRQTTK